MSGVIQFNVEKFKKFREFTADKVWRTLTGSGSEDRIKDREKAAFLIKSSTNPEELIQKYQKCQDEFKIILNLKDIQSDFSKEEIEFLQKQEQLTNLEKLRKDVMEDLAKSEKDKASEKIVDYIKENEKVYSIRNDKVQEIWIYKRGIYIPQGKSYAESLIREILGNAYTTQFFNRCLDKLKIDTYIEQEEFFKEPPVNLIPVENGILDIFDLESDLKNIKLLPFNPDIKFFNKLPVKFVEGADCPNIKKFFDDVLREDDVKTIQEIVGNVLLRENKFETAEILIGDGRNGKSKTLDIIRRFVGIENCAEITLDSMDKDEFALAELHKKLVNLCGEISKNAIKDTSKLRKLVARDLISAQRKFLGRVNFYNYSKQIFCMNILPRVDGETFGFYARINKIEFPYTFLDTQEINSPDYEHIPKELKKIKDPDIIQKITTPEELSGLLNWALKGLVRLLLNKGFTKSSTSKEIEKWWLRKSNSFSAFFEDYLELNENETIVKKELKEIYLNYCKKFGLKEQSDKVIKFFLENKDVFSERNAIREYVWMGIKFKENIGLPRHPNLPTHFDPISESLISHIGTNTIGNLDNPRQNTCSECNNPLSEDRLLINLCKICKPEEVNIL